MHYSRGDCGHIKARWDSHHSCLSCSSCSRNSTYYICSQWSDDVWILAEKRTHAMRRSVMMKKRDNKTKKKNVPDPSDTISIDGSAAPHGFTARDRTHLGGSQMQMISNRAISPPGTSHQSTRHPSTSHQSSRHRSSSHRSTRHQSTRHRSIRHQSTRHQSPVNQSPVIGQPGTGHPDTSKYLPGTSHQSVNMDYQAPGTSHQAPGSLLVINIHRSSSHLSLDSSLHTLLL